MAIIWCEGFEDEYEYAELSIFGVKVGVLVRKPPAKPLPPVILKIHEKELKDGEKREGS